MSNEERRLAAEVFGKGQHNAASNTQEQSMGAMEAVKEGFKEFGNSMYPGLNWDKMVRDIGQTLHQKGVQGLAELASALYMGQSNAYVPYGPGQWQGGNRQEEKVGMDNDQSQQYGQQQGIKQGMSL